MLGCNSFERNKFGLKNNEMRSLFPKFPVLLILILLGSCFRIKSSDGGGQVKDIKPRNPDPKDIALPEGYKIEVVTTGLTFPTGVTFDETGTAYVIEAGYSYGEVWFTPKLLRVEKDGAKTVVFEGNSKNGPWNGVVFHDGYFYIAEGGELYGGRILKVSKGGIEDVLVEGLPSMGDHHTNAPVIKDGYVYFGQGTATNSGVVGKDNVDFGWLYRYPDFHDVPCKDVKVREINYVSPNPLTEDPKDKIATGGFQPFGEITNSGGELIQGRIPCSGAILRVPIAGGDVELAAWGLRNPYGLAADEDGKLYVVENGYDVRGSRPVWGTGDVLWEVKEGAWYGWPDYSAGLPLFGPIEFAPPGCDGIEKLLAEDPAGHEKEPVAVLAVHSSSDGMDIIKNESFGKKGNILIAQFGDMAPGVGKVWSPVGFKVVQVDPSTGVISDFAANAAKKNGPASWLENGGLERPVSVKLNPEGDELYIVDFGIMKMSHENGANPVIETGVIWKVTKTK